MLLVNTPIAPIPRGAALPPVTVPAAVASLALSSPALSVAAGSTATLTATPRDASLTALTGRAVTWTSSNNGVATVGATTGIVTGVAAGSVTITATCEGVHADCAGIVTAASTLPTFANVRALSMTGAPSVTGVARGLVPFPAAANVQVADLAKYAAFNASNAEVPMFIEDLGDRHPNGALRSAMVEIPSGWTTGQEMPAFTVRPSTPAVARATKAGFTQVTTNIPDLIVDTTDPRFLRLNNSGFYYKRNANDVGRWAPGRVAMDNTTVIDGGNPPRTFDRDASQYTLIRSAVYADDTTGAISYVFSQDSGAPVGFINDLTWPDWTFCLPFSRRFYGAMTNRVPLAFMAIWLSPGSGTFTPGTTSLTDPMVAKISTTGVQTQAGGSGYAAETGPMNLAPNFVPPYILAADPADFIAGDFLPTKTVNAATARLVNTGFAAVEDAAAQVEDELWGYAGSWAGTMLAGGAVYQPSLRKFVQYARDGNVRHLRRSYCDQSVWRDQFFGAGGGLRYVYAVTLSNGTTKTVRQTIEARTDAGMMPFQYLMTGDPDALAHLEDQVIEGEEKQLNYGAYPDTSSTWRWVMHAFQGLYWMHRLSIRNTPGPVITAGYQTPFQQSHPSATGTVARFNRLCAFIRSYMGPGRGVNSSLTHLQMSAYGPASPDGTQGGAGSFPGVGAFMFHLLSAWGVVMQEQLAPADQSATLDADLMATYEYLYNAKTANGTTRLMYYRDATATFDGTGCVDSIEGFEYAEVGDPGSPVNGGEDHYPVNQAASSYSYELGGAAMVPYHRFATVTDVARAALWTNRAERLYVALRHGNTSPTGEHKYANGKASSEAHLFSHAWTAYRVPSLLSASV